MTRFLIPLAVFAVLVVFFGVGLKYANHHGDVPSPLIDKPAPAFSLPQVQNAQNNFRDNSRYPESRR